MSGLEVGPFSRALLLSCAVLFVAPAATSPAAARPANHSALVGRYAGTFTSDGGASTGDFELAVNVDHTDSTGRTLLGRGRFSSQWLQLMGSYYANPQNEAFACVLHRGAHNLVISLNLSFAPGAKSGVGDYLVTRDHVLLEHGTVAVDRP